MKQPLFAREVVADCPHGNAGLPGNVTDPGLGMALPQKEPDSGVMARVHTGRTRDFLCLSRNEQIIHFILVF